MAKKSRFDDDEEISVSEAARNIARKEIEFAAPVSEVIEPDQNRISMTPESLADSVPQPMDPPQIEPPPPSMLAIRKSYSRETYGEEHPFRKTVSMPYVLNLAMKELKDRRNLARFKSKYRTTEDEILEEALHLFFMSSKEGRDCLKAAGEKLKLYGAK